MKQIYILLFLLTSIFCNAQEAYYNDVNLSLQGEALKTALSDKVIATHSNSLSYTPGVWEASKVTDEDPSNASNVLLIYGYNDSDGNYITDRTRSKNANGGTAGTDWNREHSYPKSLGTPNLGESGPGADVHHLRPSDVTFNGNRGNRKFIDGDGVARAISGGWYPGDEWKGDVARMMMYMYIRYGSRCLPTNVGIGSNASTPDDMIDLFLEWNDEDEVSAFEIQRNTYHDSNATYAQGNRNPFIDNPHLATRIWGGPNATDTWGIYSSTDTENPTAPTNLIASNPTQTSIDINWSASTDNVGITAYEIYIGGVYETYTSNTNYTVTGLTSETNYCFTILAKDYAGNTSTVSNTACETTEMSTTGSGTELFFSEYVEGNSFNKALEIVNLTNTSVDLSSYSIKRNGNGGTSWDSSLSLSGSIASGDVFVVINSDAPDATLQAEADLKINNVAPMTFNGNDPIGLFKNDVLIDIIGAFNSGGGNFAKDITLRRKSNISSPNTTFQLATEWETFPQNTFNDIGMHTSVLSTNDKYFEEVRVYPNPVKTSLLYIKTKQSLTVEFFNVLGKRILQQQVTPNNNKVDVSNLNKGIYLIKLSSEQGSITKKLIKQ